MNKQLEKDTIKACQKLVDKPGRCVFVLAIETTPAGEGYFSIDYCGHGEASSDCHPRMIAVSKHLHEQCMQVMRQICGKGSGQ